MTDRRSLLPLLVTLVFAAGACSDRASTPGNADGGANDAAVQLDAAAQEDASPQVDAATTTNDAGMGWVPCGTESCDVTSGDTCCITFQGLTCESPSTCQGVGVRCDSPADCTDPAAPICCAMITAGGGINCQSEAACTAGQGQELCQGDADCGPAAKCCGELSFQGLTIKWCDTEENCAGTPGGPGVPCGAATCNAPQVCCVSYTGLACSDAASCTAGLPVACDGPEDCATDGGAAVCCGDVEVSTSLGGDVTCVPDGSCTISSTGGVICHTSDDCPLSHPVCSPIPFTDFRWCTAQ